MNFWKHNLRYSTMAGRAVFVTILAVFQITALSAQGWVQNGAQVVVNQGAYVVLKGNNCNFLAQRNSKFTFKGVGYLLVAGNFTNNTSSPLFTTNWGEVTLNGTTQQSIGGNGITAFPSLYIKSTVNPKLTFTVLVGGGYNKGGNGILALYDKQLLLNSQKLIVNNKSESAITYTTGGLVSETFPTAGYGIVQWNIRTAGAGPLYRIPFQTASGQNLPFDLNVKNIGSETTDSGFVTVATYPTPTASLPNNRPLPFSVPHVRNEYGVENARRMIDRFWVITDGGYRTAPEISTQFTYLDAEHSTGTNTIKEGNMGAVRWDVYNNKWSYPVKSRVSPGNNTLLYHGGINFSGIWTLSDTTPCPFANFATFGKCEKDSVLFTDLSTVVDDTLVRWRWDYANGNTGYGDSVVAYFSPSGIYKPRLIVSAASGCSDTLYKQINILGAPKANFTLEDTCENTVVKFNSLTSPGSGFISSEYWWFGDGTTYSGKSPTHYYGSSGNPTLQYIVYNTNLCKDTVTRTLYIAPKPYASFMVKPDCEDLTFPFTNYSTAGGGNITDYAWTFGNGKRSNQRNELVTYYDSGTFPVKLIVSNSFGCKDTDDYNLRVYPRAIANFKYSPDFPEMTNPVYFNNLSGISDRWDWEFGDGYYDNTQNPIHPFAMFGIYKTTLIANNQYNCPDTFSRNIKIKSKKLYWFPNAFSPGNTEGLNDKFGMETPLIITDYNLVIYDRWGGVMFQSKDQFTKWDGRMGADLVQSGVYIYDVTFKSPEMEFMHYKGDVLVLR